MLEGGASGSGDPCSARNMDDETAAGEGIKDASVVSMLFGTRWTGVVGTGAGACCTGTRLGPGIEAGTRTGLGVGGSETDAAAAAAAAAGAAEVAGLR